MGSAGFAFILGGDQDPRAGETIVTENGVTVIAPPNLPASMPAGSSAFYARNISALLLHFVKDEPKTVDVSIIDAKFRRKR